MRCPVCGAEVQATEQGYCPACRTTLTDLDSSLPEVMKSPVIQPATLSDGTVVRDRYTILEVLTCEDDRTIYIATDGGNVRLCSQCGTLTQGADSEFCDECGAELSIGRYRLTEWRTGDDFAGLDALTRSGLTHDGWLAPLDWFIWDGRRYMAQTYVEGQSLTAMSRPIARDEALTWGIILGEAIQTLHTNGFTGLSLRPDDVIVTTDRQVKIVNFRDVAIYAGGPPFAEAARTEAQQRDIQSLATILTLLLNDGNGESSLTDTPEIEPSVRAILARMTEGTYADVQAVLSDLRLSAPTPTSAASSISVMPAPRRYGMRYLVGSRSDTGWIRALNEDSLATLDLSVIRESRNETVGIYVVADGMGGHEGGEIASRLAIGTIVNHLTHPAFQPILEGEVDSLDEEAYTALLKDAIQAANDAILAVRQKSRTNMGATVTAAFIIGSFACVANVGDSRIYLLRRDRLSQLTVDHSLVARLVAVGMVRPEEVYTHPQRNQIYRALGDIAYSEIDTFLHTLLPGDQLLLCSDGLWEMVRDPTIEAVLREARSPQEACDTLVATANEHGGEDNISVIVVQAVEYA